MVAVARVGLDRVLWPWWDLYPVGSLPWWILHSWILTGWGIALVELALVGLDGVPRLGGPLPGALYRVDLCPGGS